MVRRLVLGFDAALFLLTLCAAWRNVYSVWTWILLSASVIVFFCARQRTGQAEEPEEVPPTIDGRSEATGIVRYKMEDPGSKAQP